MNLNHNLWKGLSKEVKSRDRADTDGDLEWKQKVEEKYFHVKELKKDID